MRVGGSTRLAVIVEGEDELVLRLYRRSVREGEQINALADGLTFSHENDSDLRFIGAGAPWFLTLFGRDSLITAGFLNSVDPALAMETLKLLASLQGKGVRVETAEQPGKILHEVRSEPLNLEASSGPLVLPPVYYGTIDATPLWISTLHDAWKAGANEGGRS